MPVVGTVEKALSSVLKIPITFADDLAAAGTGVTISAQPTAVASGGTVAASVLSWTPAGVVTLQVSGGKVDGVGEIAVTAVYSSGETVTQSLLVVIA